MTDGQPIAPVRPDERAEPIVSVTMDFVPLRSHGNAAEETALEIVVSSTVFAVARGTVHSFLSCLFRTAAAIRLARHRHASAEWPWRPWTHGRLTPVRQG